MTSINIFGDTYSCGAYGASTYSNGTCTSSGGGGTSGSGSSGVLSNTGFDLLLVATLAMTIIFIALVVRFWKRPGKKSAGPAEPSTNN